MAGSLFDWFWPKIELEEGSPSYEAQAMVDESMEKVLGDLYAPTIPQGDDGSDYSWIEKYVNDNRAAQQAAWQMEADFNQASADKAMANSSAEAQLTRDWYTNANKIAMDFTADQAELNRQWIDQQRSTAYQTQVADLKAAGLNPILAAHNGGAAVTSGAIGSGVSSGGSAAQSFAASSSKPDTDITTLSHLISNVTSGAFNIGSNLIGILASILTKGKLR